MAAGFDSDDINALKSIFTEAFGYSVGRGAGFAEYSPQSAESYQEPVYGNTASVNVGDTEYDDLYSEKGNLGPAPLSVIPTSSSNSKRPRTVAAGYQRYVGSKANPENRDDDAPYVYGLGKLTVMFRDGTLYNYYDVTPEEWAKFKGQLSKGPMLNWKPVPGFLLAKDHGPADLSQISDAASKTIYRIARTAQVTLANKRRVHVAVSEGGPGSGVTRTFKATGTVPKNAAAKMRAAGRNPATAGKPHKPHRPK